MTDWPSVAAVQSALGASGNAEAMGAALGAAVEQVCTDVGYVDIAISADDPPAVTARLEPSEVVDGVEPSPSLHQAALILAVMAMKAPDAPHGVAAVFDTGGLKVAAQHPTYIRMVTGQRKRFGIG
jgi:hypothetical protein